MAAADELAALAAAGPPAEQAPVVHALADWTAGIACAVQGRMTEAVAAFDRAAAGLRSAGLPDPAAQTQVPKIMALAMLGRLDDAAACAEAAQRELRRLGNLAAAGRVSLNLGGLQLRRDHYPEAARHYREAAVLLARVGDHASSVSADGGLGDALAAMGDFAEARRIFARAGMRSQAHGLALPAAIVDESLALLALARGDHRQALAGLESARRRYEALDMPQYLAIAEKQLADAYLELRLLPEALALLDRAVAEFARLECPPEQAWALLQRGRAQLGLGGPAAAEASFAEAAVLFAAQDNPVGGATVALARAEAALAGGDAAAALGFAEAAGSAFDTAAQADGRLRAAALRAQALLAAGRRDDAAAALRVTLAQAQSQQQADVQVRCLTGLGQVAEDPAEARAAFDAAIELAEAQRRVLPGDEIRAAFLTDRLRPYRERLRLALQAGDAADALQQQERFRARALGERLAETPDEAGKRERLGWLYRRVQRLQAEQGESPRLGEELRRTEQDLLEAERRRRLALPVAEAGGDGFGVPALQAALGVGEALVEYGELDDELHAFVVTRDAVRLVRGLARWPDAVASVRALRFQLDALRHGAAPLRQHLAVLTRRAELRLAQLRDAVWAPLQPALAGVQRVLVVPVGALAAAPFGALDEHRLLALAPSARVALRGLQRAAPVPRRAVALGESSALPYAGREAQAVAAGFGGQGLALVGADASLAALQGCVAGAGVVHLACHAHFRADNPRFSALHLADGPLTADLAETLNLAGATVVLSACETGLADAGDESVGLVRAFLVAGAARVVASLWPVDDAVTARLMADFYAALRAGESPAQALRAAQQALKASTAESAHPHFWGAFGVWGGF